MHVYVEVCRIYTSICRDMCTGIYTGICRGIYMFPLSYKYDPHRRRRHASMAACLHDHMSACPHVRMSTCPHVHACMPTCPHVSRATPGALGFGECHAYKSLCLPWHSNSIVAVYCIPLAFCHPPNLTFYRWMPVGPLGGRLRHPALCVRRAFLTAARGPAGGSPGISVM